MYVPKAALAAQQQRQYDSGIAEARPFGGSAINVSGHLEVVDDASTELRWDSKNPDLRWRVRLVDTLTILNQMAMALPLVLAVYDNIAVIAYDKAHFMELSHWIYVIVGVIVVAVARFALLMSLRCTIRGIAESLLPSSRKWPPPIDDVREPIFAALPAGLTLGLLLVINKSATMPKNQYSYELLAALVFATVPGIIVLWKAFVTIGNRGIYLIEAPRPMQVKTVKPISSDY